MTLPQAHWIGWLFWRRATLRTETGRLFVEHLHQRLGCQEHFELDLSAGQARYLGLLVWRVKELEGAEFRRMQARVLGREARQRRAGRWA